MLVLPNASQVRLVGYENRRKELEPHLSYIDKKVDFAIMKFKNNTWFASKYGEEAFKEKLDEMKAERKKSILFEDEQGLWTYSGMAPYLATRFEDKIERKYQLPEKKNIPWAKAPTKEPRYYQTFSFEELLKVGHGGVEIGTGLGKSFIILMLAKELGLKTVVMAPSTSIAEQLYDEFATAFGKKYVGFVGDGKKQYDKLFVIGIAASLTKLTEGTLGHKELSKAQVFIADESHLCPAATLASVCFGLVKDAKYRFFFSGTQMRNDGLDVLLDAIVGKIVFKMTVKEGVEKGFLSKPIFKMFHMDSLVENNSRDPNILTRKHLYYNPRVNQFAADVANKSVHLLNRPTLILIDELEQFTHLLPFLRCDVRFAHGGVTKENKGKIPEKYWESDPKKLVFEFNEGKFPLLIGTSCISMGTDIQAVGSMIWLRGGRSETEVKQGVGRCTRLYPGKESCIITDFCIDNVPALARHAKARKEIYQDIYPCFAEMKVP